MRPGDVAWAVIGGLIIFAVTRWAVRAVTLYPGVGTGAALSIEGSEELSKFADRLGRYGRARLAEESVD